jgi:HAL2 family 3'(2'),5'-bisphosphate nucleotidase
VISGQLADERRVAVAAVRDASRLCRAVRASFNPDHAAAKADASPVTVADLGSEAVISLALADAFPIDPVAGEEDATQLRADRTSPIAETVLEHVSALRPEIDHDRLCWALDRCNDDAGAVGRHWTVDPVDGTKGFVRGGQYAVALALIEDGQVVLGLLGCPNLAVDPADPGAGTGCLFVAERGFGAWQLPLDDAGEVSEGGALAERAIHASDSSDVSAARWAESLEPKHSSQSEAAEVARLLGIATEPMRVDSQVKYALVARGNASIYLRLPIGGYRENFCDHAAGSLLVREAGGVVTDVDGRELDFTTGRRLDRNRGILATAPALHDQVLAAVTRVLGA